MGIVEYELKKVRGRLKDRGMTLELDEKAKDFLIEKGYNPDFGARPLRRAIEQHVEDPLSESILRGEFREGQAIHVTREDGAEALKLSATGGEPGKDKDAEPVKAAAEST